MDEFDFKEEQPRKSRDFGSALWNIASILTVIASLCAGGYFTQLFLDPNTPLNPLPPATSTATAAEPSATPTDGSPTATLEATATIDPNTATPSPTPLPGSFFEMQAGSPAVVDASVFHPDAGCDFLGVAGQAFDLEGAPIPGLRVQISGTLDGQEIEKLGLTGAATAYGSGSYYEVQLADSAIASNDSLEIILKDQNGDAISESYGFSTSSNCSENLLFINFSAQP